MYSTQRYDKANVQNNFLNNEIFCNVTIENHSYSLIESFMHSIVGPDLKANNLLVFMGMGKHDSYEGDSNHNTEREYRDTFDFRNANYHIA